VALIHTIVLVCVITGALPGGAVSSAEAGAITSLSAWPVQAPLTDAQVAACVDANVVAPLLTLTLADTGGWNLLDSPTLASMYKETRAVFRGLSRSPS